MKIKFLLFLMCILSACSSCSSSFGNSPWKKTTDKDAQAAQQLMLSSVRIAKEVNMEVTYNKISNKKLEKPITGASSWTGSGVVVENDVYRDSKGSSMILTAGHVCDVPEDRDVVFVRDGELISGVARVTQIKYTIITMSGLELKAVVLSSSYDLVDSVPDICVMSSVGIAGKEMELADSLPPEGAIIQNAGFPLGYQKRWAAHIEDGRYEGLTDNVPAYALVSVPAVGGLSGSGLYYHGKLFAILVAGSTKYEHLTFATPLSDIKAELKKARKIWLE